MLRKVMIALVAISAIAAVALPKEASAAPAHHGGHGGGHGGGHWRGGGWGGGGWGWGPGSGFYGYPYAYGVAPYYGGCDRLARVATPYGWRWRRVWVCG